MALQLQDNNLYYNGYINYYEADGEGELLREKLVVLPQQGDVWHTVMVRDRLMKLAYDFYKDYVPDASKLWFVIADANNIYDPLDLTEWIGKDILIPDIIRIRLDLQ